MAYNTPAMSGGVRVPPRPGSPPPDSTFNPTTGGWVKNPPPVDPYADQKKFQLAGGEYYKHPVSGNWEPTGGGGGGSSRGSGGGGGNDGKMSVAELQLIRNQFQQQPAVSRISGPSAEQEQAARNAAFARAKDQFGSISQSALTGLRDSLARRGMGGGAYEMEGMGNIVNAGQGQLGEFTRGQAEGEVEQARHVADLEYQGQIQQRAQNQAATNALFQLIQSRGGLY